MTNQQQLDLSKLLSDLKSATKVFDTTEHGNTPLDFHRLCDKIKGTLIIAKSGDYIAGGYTDQSWSGDFDYKESDQSFLFSLNRMKKYKVENNKYAIRTKPDRFPIFGCYFIRQ